MKYVVTVVVVACMYVCVVWMCASSKGVVVLEDYEHGVSICGKEYMAIHLHEAHVWSDDVATYVINEGHYNDPQVQELVKLTHVECARLTK